MHKIPYAKTPTSRMAAAPAAARLALAGEGLLLWLFLALEEEEEATIVVVAVCLHGRVAERIVCCWREKAILIPFAVGVFVCALGVCWLLIAMGRGVGHLAFVWFPPPPCATHSNGSHRSQLVTTIQG